MPNADRLRLVCPSVHPESASSELPQGSGFARSRWRNQSRVGKLETTEKAKGLRSSFSKLFPYLSSGLSSRSKILPCAGEGQIRDHLRNLNGYKLLINHLEAGVEGKFAGDTQLGDAVDSLKGQEALVEGSG